MILPLLIDPSAYVEIRKPIITGFAQKNVNNGIFKDLHYLSFFAHHFPTGIYIP
jgi:hypothetical protein